MPSKKPILPREGIFTLDALIVLLKKTAFNPTLTLPLFLLFSYTTKGKALIKEFGRETTFKRFKLLVILGVIGRINNILSWGASNNWRRDKFKHGEEVIVVTGGSSGIGASIVQELAQYKIPVVVLDVQPLTFTASKNVYYFKVDLTSAAEISAVASKVRIQVGTPTVLINNAGVCRGKLILDSNDRDNSLTFAVNTLAHYNLVREFLPEMIKKDHGHIVTVASIGGYAQAPKMVDYNASKAAATAFHEGLRLELKYRYDAPKVRTTLVSQSYVKTPLFEGYNNKSKFMLPTLEPETIAEAIAKQVLGQESGHIVLPRLANAITMLRGWSVWVQEAFRGRTRDNMTEFKGKQVMN